MEVDPKLVEEWSKIQEEMRSKVITEDTEEWQRDFNLLERVGALDISYPKDAHAQSDCGAYAAFVICHFPSMQVLHERVEFCTPRQPYVPGFLAFRESPALCALVDRTLEEHPELKPDVLLIDGNGVLHPQKCGVACHIGLHTGIPSIGVAKNLFVMEGLDYSKGSVQNMGKVGDSTLIRDKEGDILGLALKSAENTKNPIYVSIGHKISLETGRRTVVKCCKHRVPEPLRFADIISREFVRKLEENKS